MNNHLISIVVPVYNTGQYLIKCVSSILEQSYQNFELLLIDDGSDAETFNLCDSLALLDARIKVVHQPNGGLSAARNKGIDLAKGEYIAFVDSDDYLSQTIYDELLSISEPNVLSTSHFTRVDEVGTIYKRNDPYLNTEVISSAHFVESLLLHLGDVSVCTKLFPRDVIGSTRFVIGKTNEDLLFILDILKKVQHVKFTGKVGYYYLIRTGSLSSGYGRAVIDMLGNSLIVKNEVSKFWPCLQEQAWRFVLYQHMAYLLLVPINEITGNQIYSNALSLLRSELVPNTLLNKYFSLKQKVIIVYICMFPKLTARFYQKKNKK